METRKTIGSGDVPAVFELVTGMEDDVRDVSTFATAVARLAELLDEGDGGVFQLIAWEISNRAKAIEERRGHLSRLTHPNRDHFAAVGWPSEDAVVA